MTPSAHSPASAAETARGLLTQERWALLQQFNEWLERPMLVLAFAWLVLFVIEMVWGLSPVLETAGYLIWVLFLVEFVLGFVVAPAKLAYLRTNWLKAIALLVPALRVFRLFGLLRLARAARAVRGLRLLRLVTSINRGMKALRVSMGRRGFGYVLALTLIVLLTGAAAMYAFESDSSDGRGFQSFGSALWWTAMILTTMGSEAWPNSAEGRIVCLLLALYAFAVFGYVTAALASFFVDRDARDDERQAAERPASVDLGQELAALREEIRSLEHLIRTR
jgi:voltage-gated potassium channel